MEKWTEAELTELLKNGVEGARMCQHVPESDLKALEGGTPIWGHINEGWGPEHDLVVLVKIKSDVYPDAHAVLHEGEDTTGHGCQCDANVDFFKTKDDAIRLGLTEYDRGVLLGRA